MIANKLIIKHRVECRLRNLLIIKIQLTIKMKITMKIIIIIIIMIINKIFSLQSSILINLAHFLVVALNQINLIAIIN
jgi:hypothetical protein